jgi:hypothetical protein
MNARDLHRSPVYRASLRRSSTQTAGTPGSPLPLSRRSRYAAPRSRD